MLSLLARGLILGYPIDLVLSLFKNTLTVIFIVNFRMNSVCRVKVKSNYFIVRPKVDQRAGLAYLVCRT